MKYWRQFWFLSAILVCKGVFGQTGLVEQWDARYGGNLQDDLTLLGVDANEKIYMAGFSFSRISGNKTTSNWDISCQTPDFWLVCTDLNGNKIWDKRYGGNKEDYYSAGIIEDSALVLAGAIRGGVSGDVTKSSRGDWDYWIIKLDKDGNKLWDQRLGGTQPDMLSSIVRCKDGGYLVGGHSFSGVGGDKTQPNWDPTLLSADGWVVKLDANGNKQWDMRFGGTDFDDIHSVVSLNDGGFILAGNTRSDANGDVTQPALGISSDYWILRIDSDGNKLWDKRLGTTGEDYLENLVLASDGGYILSGESVSLLDGDKSAQFYGGKDCWLVKTDVEGNKLWDKCYGGNDNEIYPTIVTTRDGGYLISSVSKSEVSGLKSEPNHGYPLGFTSPIQQWVFKIGVTGILQWEKTIWNPFGPVGYMIQLDDDCYLNFGNIDNTLGGYVGAPCLWDCSDGDGWLAKFCLGPVSVVNADLTTDFHVQVGPNPFSDEVVVQWTNNQSPTCTINLVDVTGRIIYHLRETGMTENYTSHMHFPNLMPGIYFMQIDAITQHVVVKLIRQ